MLSRERGEGEGRGPVIDWDVTGRSGRNSRRQSGTRVRARVSEWAGLGSSQLMDQTGTEQIRGTDLGVWAKPQRDEENGMDGLSWN